MKSNLGNLDRALRFFVGAVLVLLVATKVIGLWGLIGLVLIATALINFCPIYKIFGIHTNKADK